jgi:two-component system chemotaxis response regulator CheB
LNKIKVLIVDDSELIRQVLTEILSAAPDFEVVGAAEHPYEAREMIKQLNPDVLTLDIEMPKMDGISFLRNLMRLRPMPVVMISTLTEAGAPATLDALEIGAVDYVAKPQGGSWQDLQGYAQIIQDKVRNAARANVTAREVASAAAPEPTPNAKAGERRFKSTKVIALGSSTGGTEALKEVLHGMPLNCPPIVMAQHIPPAFSITFAERLNSICDITVCEAKAGMPLKPGHAYLAPGDRHLKVMRKPTGLVTALFDGEKVNGHIPSVDVLFDSVVQLVGKDTVGGVLTGMGVDGAQGLKHILEAGGATVAQDEKTSVVWGMPGAAVKMGAAQHILPIKQVRDALLKACEFKS